jgi:protoheme IX farnesyltransferase
MSGIPVTHAPWNEAVLERTSVSALARAADYFALTKPKIAALELLTVAVAMYAAGWGPPAVGTLVFALVGVGGIAAGASVFNQLLEIDLDRRMRRTAERPLPSGRVAPRDAFRFGAALTALGAGALFLGLGPITGLLGLANWLLYVAVYTPLKTRTSFNTVVGAVAGAWPVLIGWAAAGGTISVATGTLFMIVFLWQFPHFMAIAWLYREQYAKAGMQMLPVVDPTGLRAGRQAVVASLALGPVSLLPAVTELAGPVYFGGAAALAVAYSGASGAFLWRRGERSARTLLLVSLVHLPLLLALLAWRPGT